MPKGKMKRSEKVRNAAIILVAGLVMVAYSNRGLSKAKASASWPGTKGEIISSDVEGRIFGLGKGNREHVFKARYPFNMS